MTLSARQNQRYFVPPTSNTLDSQCDSLGFKTDQGSTHEERQTKDVSDECLSARAPYQSVSTRSQSRLRPSLESRGSKESIQPPKIFSIEMLEKAIRDVGNNQVDIEVSQRSQRMQSSQSNFRESLKIPSLKDSTVSLPKDEDTSLVCEDADLAQELDVCIRQMRCYF